MNDIAKFNAQRMHEIREQAADKELRDLTGAWIAKAAEHNYSYHFDWLGRPIIQHPQDMIAMQQLLWTVQPDLIVETGIARGGSLIFYASLLELIAQCGGKQDAKVLGIDIDIRPHNKKEILDHPMSKRIELIEGSSVSTETFEMVSNKARGQEKVLVCLDSDHTHAHVLEELKLYSTLVSEGSYCVVFDTVVEDFPEKLSASRPWGKSDNPKTAVWEFLDWQTKNALFDNAGQKIVFSIDKEMENTLLITVAPDGFLKRI